MTSLVKNENRMGIVLTGDRILVRRIKTATKTKSGLTTPSSSQKEHVISEVIQKSPDMDAEGYGGFNIPLATVIVTRAAGMPVPATLVLEDDDSGKGKQAAFEIDEETRYIVRASDIIAFYTENE